MKNKTFSSASQGSPKALPALYPPLPKWFAWSLRCRASFKKGKEAATLYKWFTGPEICFAQLSCLNTGSKTAHGFQPDALNHTLAFAAAKIQ
ncbi:hypothetical protein [Agrobacterium fabrum]|uniref:hypothetical protein n=1 Tax=Agrobacterium fabrum TaxID=1176649 RepID=UPI003B9E3DD3